MSQFRDCRFICCVINKECCGCCILGRCKLDLQNEQGIMGPGLFFEVNRPGSAWWPRHQTGGNKAHEKSRN
jgi:hypothetical protein